MTKQEKSPQNTPMSELSSGQIDAIDSVKSGRNTVITGPAGTGKSFVLDQIKKEVYGITLCGSTGVSAVNIGGRTLHNFLGLGLGEDSAEEIFRNLQGRKNVLSRIRQCKVLVIDEISMIDGELLDKADEVMRLVRNSSKPFGGVQCVVVGDFYQLPPVKKEKGFAFESKVWKEADFHCVHFNKIFRQKNYDFISNLLKIREGSIDQDVVNYFDSRVDKKFIGEIEPVEIFTTNKDVERINIEKMSKLNTEQKTYYSHDNGHKDALSIIEKNCPAAQTISLKKGCQVMLLANLSVEEGFVNGSVGKVEGFRTNGDPIVKFKNGKMLDIERHSWEITESKRIDTGFSMSKPLIKKEVIAARHQIPLRVCYAVTSHKVQGSTLDCAKINLTKIFDYGMAYVALSRVKDIESLFIEGGVDWSKVKAHPKVIQFYKEIDEKSSNRESKLDSPEIEPKEESLF